MSYIGLFLENIHVKLGYGCLAVGEFAPFNQFISRGPGRDSVISVNELSFGFRLNSQSMDKVLEGWGTTSSSGSKFREARGIRWNCKQTARITLT